VQGGGGGRTPDGGGRKCRASSEPPPLPSPLPPPPPPQPLQPPPLPLPPVETVSSLIGESIPAVMQQPAGLTFSQTMVYSACFAVGLMVLVGSLRPALVVLHNAWNLLWRGKRMKPFTDSFYGWIYKSLRTALLMVRAGGGRGHGAPGSRTSATLCVHRRLLRFRPTVVRKLPTFAETTRSLVKRSPPGRSLSPWLGTPDHHTLAS
jgi:hypothetical protein